jgi:hypothetical protein
MKKELFEPILFYIVLVAIFALCCLYIYCKEQYGKNLIPITPLQVQSNQIEIYEDDDE